MMRSLVPLAFLLSLVLFAHGFVRPSAQRKVTRQAFAPRSRIMMLAEGDRLPMDSSFQTLVDGKPSQVSASDLFAGKKIVVFAVPGAFTSTCNNAHAPGYISKIDEFKSKGVDAVVCLAVNDPFVLNAWAKQLGADGKVEFLGDGGAIFAQAVGLSFDTGGFGGIRLKRSSMLVEDGVVTKLFVENNGSFTEISAADTILNAL